MWDTATEFGQRVERRLADEQVIWLVTVASDGTPQPSPVWFVREGETLVIFSKPETPKVRNLRERPRVAVHFNTNPEGEDVVVFTGTAELDPTVVPIDQLPAYLEKYGTQIPAIGLTPETMAATYSQGIRVRLDKLRGF